MKFIKGNQYTIRNTTFTYDGIWPGHFCDRCGKPRELLHAFTIGEPGNPSQVTKYGTECIKHINIKHKS